MNQTIQFSRARLILGIDSCAGLFAGLLVVLIPFPFNTWYLLPKSLFIFTGIINIIYGLYSGSLFRLVILKKPLKRYLIHLLIAANGCWSIVCIVIILMNRETISLLGTAHFALEGIFVSALAILEFYFVLPTTTLQ